MCSLGTSLSSRFKWLAGSPVVVAVHLWTVDPEKAEVGAALDELVSIEDEVPVPIQTAVLGTTASHEAAGEPEGDRAAAEPKPDHRQAPPDGRFSNQ